MNIPANAQYHSISGVEHDAFSLHQEATVELPVAQDVAFSYLDNHRNLSNHMSKPSWMMVGSKMSIELDSANGCTEGSLIRLRGSVLGIPIGVDERVIERRPPYRKVWQTLGIPRLLLIGGYRMGFAVAPRNESSALSVFIDYNLPTRGIGRWLSWFGNIYARWCVSQIARDARAHLMRVSR
jgi:hypothetical protein